MSYAVYQLAPAKTESAAALIGAALALTAAPARACPICLAAVELTPGQRLDYAAEAVLARPIPGGANAWQVIARF